jgi:hypothetical protein
MDCELTDIFREKGVWLCDMWRFGSTRPVTRALICISFLAVVMAHGPATVIEGIGFDMFTTALSDQLSQFFIVLLAVIFINNISRKRVGSIISLIGCGCSLILLFYEKPGECDFCYYNFIELAIFIIFKGTVSFFKAVLIVYVCEAFPNTIRGSALAVHLAAGQVAAIVTPIMLAVMESLHLKIMTFFLMFAFLNFIAADFLPETRG